MSSVNCFIYFFIFIIKPLAFLTLWAMWIRESLWAESRDRHVRINKADCDVEESSQHSAIPCGEVTVALQRNRYNAQNGSMIMPLSSVCSISTNTLHCWHNTLFHATSSVSTMSLHLADMNYFPTDEAFTRDYFRTFCKSGFTSRHLSWERSWGGGEKMGNIWTNIWGCYCTCPADSRGSANVPYI